MDAIDSPACRSTSASRSTNERPSRSASSLPTVDLPVAMNPPRRRGRSMSGGSTTKAPGKGTLAPPSAAPQQDVKGEDQTNKPTQPDLDVREDAAGVVIRVRAKPRASRSRVVGCTEGALDVAIAAPPVDGAANDELMRTLAAHFGLPRRCVML